MDTAKTEDVFYPTLNGLLEELAWASIQLTAWERMATAIYGMSVRNPTPATKHASFVTVATKRKLYEQCQNLLSMINELKEVTNE